MHRVGRYKYLTWRAPPVSLVLPKVDTAEMAESVVWMEAEGGIKGVGEAGRVKELGEAGREGE